MIQENSSRFTVSKMCQTMEVSRSGYYESLRRPESERSKRQNYVLEKIRSIHRENHEIYGSPTITAELNNEGIPAGRSMVSRLMRKNGIKSRIKRKYKATTDSDHNLPVAENILNREFTAYARNQKWLSDITYIWTDEGWLYLSGILDVLTGLLSAGQWIAV